TVLVRPVNCCKRGYSSRLLLGFNLGVLTRRRLPVSGRLATAHGPNQHCMEVPEVTSTQPEPEAESLLGNGDPHVAEPLRRTCAVRGIRLVQGRPYRGCGVSQTIGVGATRTRRHRGDEPAVESHRL